MMFFGWSVFVFAATSWATSFIQRPFPEAVQDSPEVVRGRVGMSYADWAKGIDSTQRIYTFTEIQIDEVLKGGLNGRTVVVRELGGEKDGVGMQVPGAAQFQKGEEVVLFLGEKNPDGSYNMRGMSMGKFNLEKDPEGRETLVGAGLSGAHFVGGHGDSDGGGPKKWSIDRLRELIAEQARASGNQAVVSRPLSAKSRAPAPTPSAGREETSPPTPGRSDEPQPEPADEERALPPWAAAIGVAIGAGSALLLARRIKKR